MDAETELRTVLKSRECKDGEIHRDTLHARSELAICLLKLGRPAEEEERALLSQISVKLGTESPTTLQCRHNLAVALYDQRRYSDAEKEMRATAEARGRVLGAEQPDTLSSRFVLASSLFKMGRQAEAEEEFQAVLAIREHGGGAGNAAALSSRECIASLLIDEKQFPEALVHLRILAEHSVATAQYQIEAFYGQGVGVKQDYLEAYKWAGLAAMQGHPKAKESLQTLSAILPPTQVAEGRRRVAEFKPAAK